MKVTVIEIIEDNVSMVGDHLIQIQDGSWARTFGNRGLFIPILGMALRLNLPSEAI